MKVKFFISYSHVKNGVVGFGNADGYANSESVTMDIIRGWEKELREIFKQDYVNILFFHILR